ncbi:hypothetical protein ABH313_18945 [Chromobacterium vaccinii]|uniref:hypothetical protein n=1 Tax=Chromobacterium vaccinii TaxID=1108595 RepID=UPI0032608861
MYDNFYNFQVESFLDGRDTPPRSAETYLKRLDAALAEQTGCSVRATIRRRLVAQGWRACFQVELLTRNF